VGFQQIIIVERAVADPPTRSSTRERERERERERKPILLAR
jgi:hypothetical protein